MAVTAQNAIFGYGGQTGKGVAASTFYRHKVLGMDLDVLDDVRVGQLEIGGSPFATFPYKAGYVVGGGVDLQPRMNEAFGWLLFGALGNVAAVAQIGTTDAYRHVFKPNTADLSQVRWMTLRRYLPMKDADIATDLYTTLTDCKPVGLSFGAMADQPLTARVDFLGRTFTHAHTSPSWTWANTYEDWESIPVGCEVGGSFEFTGGTLVDEALPVVGARAIWGNTPLDIQSEKVIGDPSLEDITIVTRGFALDFTVKYNNPDLYALTQTGSTTGTGWTSSPLTGALSVVLSAPTIIDDVEKYRIEIDAQNMLLQQNGPVVLGAGRAIFVRYIATALEPDSGDFATIGIVNGRTTTYAWPV